MGFGSRGILSVVELVVYVPTFIIAIIICSRHGFARASGWIYTVILCLVRIVAAVCQLLTYTDHSTGLLKATLIIDSIGISPLLLATLGMLSRYVDWINSRTPTMFGMKHFRLIQLLISIGLILSIVGGTSGSTSPDGKVTVSGESKAGIALYLVAFAAMAALTVFTSGYRSSVPLQERHIPVAVAVALPLIFVRLLYSTLAVFSHSTMFSIVYGSVGVRAGMAVAEEFLVVVIYLALGYKLEKVAIEHQGELATRQWKQRGGRRENRSEQA